MPDEINWDAALRADQTAAVVRQRLRRLGLTPRKYLGQNFLVDPEILARILEIADVSAGDTVVEVGPGLGVLTHELVRRAARVVAVEKDPELVAVLQRALKDAPNLELVLGDVLRFDPAQYGVAPPYMVVANLPYYVTSPTIRRFFEEVAQPTAMVLMVQREVAERMVAKPGEMSLLSVSVQFYAEARLSAIVPPDAFYPIPKVESAIVRLDVYPQPCIEVETPSFFRMVQAGFSQPRKQLHNTLAQRIWFPPGGASQSLRSAGIDPQRRAQTLSMQEWETLWKVLAVQGYLKPVP